MRRKQPPPEPPGAVLDLQGLPPIAQDLVRAIAEALRHATPEEGFIIVGELFIRLGETLIRLKANKESAQHTRKPRRRNYLRRVK